MLDAIARQGAGAAFNAVVSLALLAFLAREMGPAGFGEYIAVLGAALVALIAIEGGWPLRIYRDAAGPGADPAKLRADIGRALSHVLRSAALLAVLASLAALLGLLSSWAWATAMACMGAVALMNLASARLRGAGRFGTEAIWQGAGRLVSAVFIAMAVATLAARPTIVFAAWTVALALLLVAVGRTWLARPNRHGAGFGPAVPFLVCEALIALLYKAETAILGGSGLPAQSLSHYAACTRLAEATALLLAPVTNVLLHGLRMRESTPDGRRLLWRALGAAFAVGVSALGVGAAVAPWLMPTLFGPGFEASSRVLPWVLAALPFSLCTLVACQAAYAAGRERTLATRLAIGAALFAAGLWFGAREAGAIGAAVGALLAHALLAAACIALAARRPSARA